MPRQTGNFIKQRTTPISLYLKRMENYINNHSKKYKVTTGVNAYQRPFRYLDEKYEATQSPVFVIHGILMNVLPRARSYLYIVAGIWDVFYVNVPKSKSIYTPEMFDNKKINLADNKKNKPIELPKTLYELPEVYMFVTIDLYNFGLTSKLVGQLIPKEEFDTLRNMFSAIKTVAVSHGLLDSDNYKEIGDYFEKYRKEFIVPKVYEKTLQIKFKKD